MLETDLFLIFIRKFNQLGLDYMVTGSIASILYGEPRVTHDVDLVVVLRDRVSARALIGAFPLNEFYCPPEEVIFQEQLRSQRGHFNIIHHESGFKADVYLAGRDPLHAWALKERIQLDVSKVAVWVAPIEYVILRKLEYFREGGSEKHLRDVAAMRDTSGDKIRRTVLETWMDRLNLREGWRRALETQG